MKRYLLFLCTDYYSYGGMNDFIGHYDTINKALEFNKIKNMDYNWYHIWDCKLKKIVINSEFDAQQNDWITTYIKI